MKKPNEFYENHSNFSYIRAGDQKNFDAIKTTPKHRLPILITFNGIIPETILKKNQLTVKKPKKQSESRLRFFIYDGCQFKLI